MSTVLFRNILLITSASCAIGAIGSSDSGIVHEWGTFTSVAGPDGSAVSWQSLSGPSDLPCFVHKLDQRNLKVAAYGTVRMETPVMYFYPLKPATISVHVDFPHGRITEWYSQASSVQPVNNRQGWISWNDINVSKTDEPLPKLAVPSHYCAARATDAWPLEVKGEKEKLLFYRGIATFAVDLKPVVRTDDVVIRNAAAETIPEVILFENHTGRTAYHVIHRLREAATVKFSELSGSMDDLSRELESDLIEMGLYRKEAHAMLETWRDSWFEEGLRAFYIVPRAKVDSLLPVSISPAPAQFARVFVGRVELLSPQMRLEIRDALQSGDISVLKKYGRFLNAFLREMSGGSDEPPMCDRSRQFLQKAYAQALEESWKSSCSL